jgi:DNA-binding response OmpR family regulator
MNLKTLLLSSDEKAVHILRRVLSDLEISVEHCFAADEAILLITRQRYEAIIVDASNREKAASVLEVARAAPINKRALTIVLVESSVGLKGGFDMGAHFVLYKPFAVERAKASFRAVRAMMRRERRLQLRIPVEVPVECYGSGRYKATTIDISEGGMAIQFIGRVAKDESIRVSFELPGMGRKLDINGDLAWETEGDKAGVRFTNASDEQRMMIQQWMNGQLPEPEPDGDPPVNCRLTDLSLGGCYLTTTSPFPRGTRIILSIKTADFQIRTGGIVLVAHPEFGMGVEFLQTTREQRDQAHRMVKTLRTLADKTPELQVEPDGLVTASPDDSLAAFQSAATDPEIEDTLLDLFRYQFQAPVEIFLHYMREQRPDVEAQLHARSR